MANDPQKNYQEQLEKWLNIKNQLQSTDENMSVDPAIALKENEKRLQNLAKLESEIKKTDEIAKTTYSDPSNPINNREDLIKKRQELDDYLNKSSDNYLKGISNLSLKDNYYTYKPEYDSDAQKFDINKKNLDFSNIKGFDPLEVINPQGLAQEQAIQPVQTPVLPIKQDVVKQQKSAGQKGQGGGGTKPPAPPTPPAPDKTEDLATKLEQELENERQNRNMMNAIGQITRGFEKMGAGMGGGSITQLKPDYAASEGLEKMGQQGVEDTKERIKSLLEKKKMLDASNMDKDKLQLEKDKLAWEKTALDKQLNAQKEIANLKKKTEGLNLTKGEEALDRTFAKDYVDWNTTGKATFDKNIKRLEDTKNELEKVKKDWFGTSGNVTGRLPDFMRSSDSRRIQQDVQSAAQMGLRQTLGPQFTEKEGERIMAFSYDPTLPPEENIKKINATIAELKAGAKSKDDMSQYFEDRGTLKGYEAKHPLPKSSSQNSDMIKVRGPDGKVREIPSSMKDAALKAGGTLI